jgi:hypothetical protein
MPRKPLTPSIKLKKKQLLPDSHVRAGRRQLIGNLQAASSQTGSKTGSGTKKDLFWGLVQNKNFAKIATITGVAAAVPFLAWYYDKLPTKQKIVEKFKQGGHSEKTASKKTEELLPLLHGKKPASKTEELPPLLHGKKPASKTEELPPLLHGKKHVVIPAGNVTLPSGAKCKIEHDVYVQKESDDYLWYALFLSEDAFVCFKKEFDIKWSTDTRILSLKSTTHKAIDFVPAEISQIAEYTPIPEAVLLVHHFPYVHRIDVNKKTSIHCIWLRGKYYTAIPLSYFVDNKIKDLEKNNYVAVITPLYLALNYNPSVVYDKLCACKEFKQSMSSAMKDPNKINELCKHWGTSSTFKKI